MLRKSDIIQDIIRLFSCRMLITHDALREVLTELYSIEKYGFLFNDIASYDDESAFKARKFSKGEINLTTDYTNPNIPASIAYHRIEGVILAESNWRFSTKRFRQNVIDADNNPMITAHFISINSGGGEAWFLDAAADAVKQATKPVITHAEDVMASAALWLGMNADKIFAATRNEIIGSVGVMVSFLDIIPYFEALGAKYYEEYSSHSDLKNKKFNDLLDGKPEQYIKEELDPLAEQFVAALKSARKKVAKLGDDHPVFRGETFATPAGIEIGLIDGQMLIEEAIDLTWQLGEENSNRMQIMQSILSGL